MSSRTKTDTTLADIIEIISVVFTISRTGQEPVASGKPKILRDGGGIYAIKVVCIRSNADLTHVMDQ